VKLRVLHVEDNPLDAELMSRLFTDSGCYEVAWTRVETEADYLSALASGTDIVIADYSLPQFSGLRALELLKGRQPDLPFILVSGTIGEEKAAEAIRLGAHDYLLKDRLTRLVRAVAEAMERAAHKKAKADIEAGLRRAQAMAKLAHVITGPDGAFESWSETLPQLAGVEADRLPRSTRAWLQLIHPADRDLFRAKALEAACTRTRTDVRYRLHRPGSAALHVRQTMEPLIAGHPAPRSTRWFNTLQDITDQVLAQQELRESEGLKSAILEASLDALVTIDEAGRIGEFNPAAEAIFGFCREQVLGKPMAELLIPPRLREAHERGLERYRATGDAPILGKRLELEALRADGSEFPVELAVVPIAGRATPTFAAFIRDITQPKLAQARINRLNRVYAVLSGINSAIVRIRDRQKLFEEACRIAIEAGQFIMAWIGIVDNCAARVTPVAAAGGVGDFLERAPLAVLENKPGGHCLVGRAVRAKTAMVSNDVKRDPQGLMRKELEERGINSVALLPLLLNGEAVGIVALYATDVGFFDEQEMRLLGELASDISYALDHIEKSEKLNYISYYDPLTGTPNRTLFQERLKVQLEDAARDKQKLALLIVDIERFKTINDTLGRHAGDALLKEIAKRIKQGGQPTSWFARIGADQFALVVPEVGSEEELARRVEQRLGQVFGTPFTVADTQLRISARIGIALFPTDGTDTESLFRNAEAALKKAKATGERYLFYTQEMTARIAENLTLENKLRQALERDEFILHYQPKVELEGRRIVGLEALLRWQSPELGLVPPMKFIPLLEETGLIIQVGAWALKRAARDHRVWADAGLNPPRVAVNVSAIQLRQRDFVRMVEQAIIQEGASPGIDLEITESLIMENIQSTIQKLAELRRLGVGVAIDDFGTGYSSLAYLARLPAETLKIDRSFIKTMAEDPGTMTLIQTIISLAHSLHLRVVAEGVETEEQARILRLLRCDEAQGYLFSRPVPSGDIAALLQTS
jgi:diguanylate cyclase (GGDEF)-like protein/PAS domain S-box-containing protein